MKRTLILLSAVLGLSLVFSCSESKDNTGNDTGSVVEQTEETIAQNSPAPADGEKTGNVASRATAQFQQLGLELTDEQEQQIQGIASRYDFEGATSRDARKAMRQEFQKEIFENVLTQEQRDKFNQKRDTHKQGR